MGNTQSTDGGGGGPTCPPLCRALCFGSPQLKDDGEWFGELPREKKRKKKKSRSSRSLNTMPAVPEVSLYAAIIIIYHTISYTYSYDFRRAYQCPAKHLHPMISLLH